jgi:hypothetical protein
VRRVREAAAWEATTGWGKERRAEAASWAAVGRGTGRESRWRKKAATTAFEVAEAAWWRCEGVGKVEHLDELGVEEAPGAEARLHYHKPWGALRVVGEHDEAAQWPSSSGSTVGEDPLPRREERARRGCEAGDGAASARRRRSSTE